MKKTTRPAPKKRPIVELRDKQQELRDKQQANLRRARSSARRALASARSTALVRQRVRVPAHKVAIHPPIVPATGIERQLLDGINIGALGLEELILTEAEEKILAEPVPRDRVLLKPQKKGPPLPYLPHQEYTRWFNRAFGRGRWQLVPVGKPALVPSAKKRIDPETGEEFGSTSASIVCPYVFYVHGKAVAFAQGEQEYFEGNQQQTYGDALESTVGNALRRCAKRLGVGLELWDKDWIREFLAGQKGEDRRWTEPTAERAEPARGYNSTADELITKPQRRRLVTIARHVGRSDAEVAVWLAAKYGLASSRDIKRRDYDAICKAVEAPGALPMPTGAPTREPGEDA